MDIEQQHQFQQLGSDKKLQKSSKKKSAQKIQEEIEIETEANKDHQTTQQQISAEKSQPRKKKQRNLSQNQKNQKTSKSKKSKNSFQMHVCRFFKYQPSQIDAMAYNKSQQLICVGRSDNSVEIWKIESWAPVIIYKLPKECKISKILFFDEEKFNTEIEEQIPQKTQNNLINFKFVVVCLNGSIMQFDQSSIQPKQIVLCAGGGVWDADICFEKKFLAIANEDGCIRIFNMLRENEFLSQTQISLEKMSRNFQSKRVLSVCWDNYQPSQQLQKIKQQQQQLILFASFDDGIVRKLDFSNNLNVLLTINVREKVSNQNKEKTFGWRIRSLKDNQLVVGCNNGALKFYETQYGTLLANIKEHQADVFSLAINFERDTVFASGADSKIISVQYINNKWTFTSQERGQSHDIKSIQYISDTMLISGGITTDICIYRLNNNRFVENNNSQKQETEKQTKKFKRILGLPCFNKTFQIEKQFVLVTKTFSVELWMVQHITQDYIFLIEIQSKEQPIISAALSKSAKFIAYSTSQDISVFSIQLSQQTQQQDQSQQYTLKKITTIVSKQQQNQEGGATCLMFGPRTDLLYYINSKKHFYVQDFTRDEETLIDKLDKSQPDFMHMEISHNERFLAIGSKVHNIIHIYQINQGGNGQKSQEFRDTLMQQKINKMCTIPNNLVNRANFTVFKFDPTCMFIYIVYDNNVFCLFDPKANNLLKWSSDNLQNFPSNYLSNPLSQTQNFNNQISKKKNNTNNNTNKIIGICFNPENNKRVMLYAHYYYVVVNLDEKIPKNSQYIRFEDKNAIDEPRKNFDVVNRKNPILFMDKFNQKAKKEFMLIEASWQQMLADIPDAINAKQYGL